MKEKDRIERARRRVLDGIDSEGFDYYLRHHSSPDCVNEDDPDLAAYWRAYIDAANQLLNHLGDDRHR